MIAELACPKCQTAIPLEDVNVASDVALCRACGNTTRFSLISSVAEVSSDNLVNPPKWICLENGFDGETTITYRRVSPALLFFIPFTAFWSGFSMCGIYGSQILHGKFDLGESLFGIPFLIGTIGLLAAITYLAFGRWVVKFNRGEGTVFCGVGTIGWTRHFSYNQNTFVSLTMTNVRVNDQSQKGISIRNDREDFVFGTLIREEAKRFIAAAILQEVQSL